MLKPLIAAIVFVASYAAVASIEQEPNKWVKVAHSNAAAFYLNPTKYEVVQPAANHEVDVWIKWTSTQKQHGLIIGDYAIEKTRLACDSVQDKNYLTYYYHANGDLFSAQTNEDPQYAPIVPESAMELVLSAACGKAFNGGSQ